MIAAIALYTELSDDALLERVGELVRKERRATARLIAALAELERRRLYLAQGCASMFSYCTQVLHLSEHAAYNRIEAARASMRFPVILDRLDEGAVTLTAVRLLAPALTFENHEQLLADATHKTKKEVEVLVARLRPLPDAPAIVRRLATGTSEAPKSAAHQPHAANATNEKPAQARALVSPAPEVRFSGRQPRPHDGDMPPELAAPGAPARERPGRSRDPGPRHARSSRNIRGPQ